MLFLGQLPAHGGPGSHQGYAHCMLGYPGLVEFEDQHAGRRP